MDAEYGAVAPVVCGSAYWDYSRGDGFGILNADGSEQTVLWDAIVRPAPERIAGAPGTWTDDDATRTLVVRDRAAGDAPSVLRAPARVPPTGFVVEVDCGGAAVTVTIRPAG
ncbi:MAG: hypothetical protein FJ137_19660 [Deltaproteobacteria bacterium]|nr:hypothetical protein [Deltaproteobacteria bacterium]